MTGEITTLEHELRNHTVEARALVTLALGLLAELAEVSSGLRDVFLEQVEVDARGLACKWERNCQHKVHKLQLRKQSSNRIEIGDLEGQKQFFMENLPPAPPSKQNKHKQSR